MKEKKEDVKENEVPSKKELTFGERLFRILYIFVVLAVISGFIVCGLQNIYAIIFENLVKFFANDTPKDFPEKIGAFFWIVAWFLILTAEIVVVIKKCWGIILIKTGTIATLEMIEGYSWTAEHGDGINRINCFYYPFEKCRIIEGDEFPEPPYMDVVKKTSYLLDLKVQSIDIPAQDIITKDKMPVVIDGFVYGFIYDSQKAIYAIKHLRQQIVDLSESTLRVAGGGMVLTELIAEEGKVMIVDKVESTLDKTVRDFGFKIKEVRLKKVDPTEEMKKKMEELAMSDIDRKAIINVAKGKSQAKILHGAGNAGAIKVMRRALEQQGDGIGSNQGKDVMVYEYITNTLPKIADGKSTKILLPTELSGVASLVTGIVESVKDAKQETTENIKAKDKKSDKEV